VASAATFSEFPSLLRKLVNKATLQPDEAATIFDQFRRMGIRSTNATPALLQQSWSVAVQLGQSDTFDSMGYAVAQRSKANFVTSDERFFNAARSTKLKGLQFVK
jgi:predicted nucleic acid-binding protein